MRMILFLAFIFSVDGNSVQETDLISYNVRPSVDQVRPQEHNNFGPEWESFKDAIMRSSAQVFEMYPDHELYFLARDGEFFYDFLKLAGQDHPDILKRIHIINVSSRSIMSPHLKAYLEQEGILNDSKGKKKKFLLFDSGYQGSIYDRVRKLLSKDMIIDCFLIISYHKDCPSSRSFFRDIEGWDGDITSYKTRRMMDQFESIEHYTSQTLQYDNINGRWEPLGKPNSKLELGKFRMEDLHFYWMKSETRQKFDEERRFWRFIRSMIDNGQWNTLKAFLKSLDQGSKHERSLAQDVLDILNRPTPSHEIPNMSTLRNFTYQLKDFVEEFPQFKGSLNQPLDLARAVLKDHKDEFQLLFRTIKSEDFERVRLEMDQLIGTSCLENKLMNELISK